MRKTIFSILLGSILSFSFLSTNAADVCKYKVTGSVVCGNGVIDNVNATLSAKLNGTTVTNQITVDGFLNTENANLNNVQANGIAHINGTVVTGDFKFNGSLTLKEVKLSGILDMTGFLTAEDSQLGTIDITSNNISLKGTSTKDITVHKTKHDKETIYLQTGTTVNGNITFESGNGYVVEEGGTVIGNVIGGKIVS